ncbi:MAG TPA: ABC transporter permease, partial [Gaiellales bacterium]|nr:ABC transporter permease [Gaiellales bacterium]
MTTVAEPRAADREVSPVLAFVGRRLLGAAVSLLVASVLIFIGTSVLPGNAASVVLGRGATPAAVQKLEKQMHLNKPLTTQYTNWLGGFVHGDLGDSSIGLAQGQKHAPVWALISDPVKNSLILALITALFMIPLSLGLGAIAA